MTKFNNKISADLDPQGMLGQLFTRAKTHNIINAKLKTLLPNNLTGLNLSLIKDNTAVLMSTNPAVVFRAQKQTIKLISILKKINKLAHITKIEVKISIKN